MQLTVSASSNRDRSLHLLQYEYDGPTSFGDATVEIVDGVAKHVRYMADEAIQRSGAREVTCRGYVAEIKGHGLVAYCQCAASGKEIVVSLSQRPDLRAAIDAFAEIKALGRAAQNAFWAAEKAAAESAPLTEMAQQLTKLVALIPSDHERVMWVKTGAFDGYEQGYHCLADGTQIEMGSTLGPRKALRVDTLHATGPLRVYGECAVTEHGMAIAQHEGALSPFASEWVASISKAQADEIRAAVTQRDADSEALQSEADRNAEAQKQDLLTTTIPDEALADYNQYSGNSEAAWEDGSEAAWASINKWAPYIEAQGLSKLATASRVAKSARGIAREMRTEMSDAE